MFLKSAQLDREKRELERKRNNSAIILQSACRKYIELLKWRINLSQNWNGLSIAQFKYFFPYLVTTQDIQQSLNQLVKINNNLPEFSIIELKNIEDVLIESFILLLPKNNDQNRNLQLHILQLLDECFTLDKSREIKSPCVDEFISSLLSLYASGELFVLKYLLKLSQKISSENLIELFINPNIDIIKDSISNQLIPEFVIFEFNIYFEIFSHLKDDPKYFESMSNMSKILFLSHISISINTFELKPYRKLSYEIIIPVIQALLNSISQKIIVVEDENLELNVEDDINGFKVKKDIFNSIKPLFQIFDSYSLSTDMKIGYISSLLHFILFINGDQANSLKLNLDINWIFKENNSELVLKCFTNISSATIYQNCLSNKKITEDLSHLFSRNNDRKWWDSLIVFQEFLSSIISITTDDSFFKTIIISKSDLINFIKFLKHFVVETLLRYRDINKENDYNFLLFLEPFKNLLSLLHMLFMKNLKLNLLDQNFWILTDYYLELKSIASAIPLLEKIHSDNFYLKDSNNLDFLQSSKIIQLFKNNVPKRVVDLLYILTYVPFMIPFEKRAEIFHYFIEFDKQNNNVNEWFPTKVEGVVARDNVLFDSYKSFGNLTGTEFKRQFSVQFVNKFGEKEAGIDGGGLTKELLTTLVSSTFIPSEENRKNNSGLQIFKVGEDYKLYCNPEFYFKVQYERSHPNEIIHYACSNEEYLKISRFLGMVIGKCLYDNVLLDISFTSFFLNTCAKMGSQFFKNLIGDTVNVVGHSNSFDELKNLDIDLFKSLNYILLQTDEEKFENMSLLFTVNDIFYDANGESYNVEVPLVPLQRKSDGSSLEPVPVTVKNKMQFVRLMTNFKLSKQSDLVMKYFVEGLFQVIKPYWLLLFNPYELQTLLSGDDDAIDINDLKENVVYGGFLDTDETIIDLFDLLKEFNKEDRGKFIKFVTSSSKQPLLGFKELNPKFGIRNSGSDRSRLPTASTCMNLLKIPDYRDKKLLKKKLLYSINSDAGFDLS
ncbi:hypothetical protein C6P40_002198 [Pichia californica]|uniref:HECT-type E3 ubiquitin transferase n=1 Tax=Pichia californica TaxID=460514 RepID=A0A9P6WK23_9ASCO|nr:hypothetical protein C6P40_002198 [[Candida] californica]